MTVQFPKGVVLAILHYYYYKITDYSDASQSYRGTLHIRFFLKTMVQQSEVRQLKQMGRKAVERPSNRNRIVVVTITALSTDVPAFIIIVVIITGLQRVFCLLWRAVYGQLEHACFRQISVSVEMLSQVAGLSRGRCQFGPRGLTSADNALMVTTTIRFRFDGLSTAFRTSQGLSDVTHQWPLTRQPSNSIDLIIYAVLNAAAYAQGGLS